MFLFTKQKSQQDSKFREAYKIGKKEKKRKTKYRGLTEGF